MKKIIVLLAVLLLVAGFGAAETDFTGNTVINPMGEVTIGGEGDSIDMNWYEIRGGGVILHITTSSGSIDGIVIETGGSDDIIVTFDGDGVKDYDPPSLDSALAKFKPGKNLAEAVK